MRPLLLSLLVPLLAGCAVHRHASVTPFPVVSDTADFTPGQSTVCEVHGTIMSAERVPLLFGLREHATAEDEARRSLFPHAGEPYDTGLCIPLMQEYGRIFVCSRCTEARTVWFRTNPPGHD